MTIQPIKSSIQGFQWPALSSTTANAMLALQFQLDESQWLSSGELFEKQLLQMAPLFNHAYCTMGVYEKKYRQAGLLKKQRMRCLDEWRKIPIITRSEVQEAGEQFVSERIPASHGPVGGIKTSGSTGKPITVQNTGVVSFFSDVFTLREHLWHQRDFSQRLAIIRWLEDEKHALAPEGLHLPGWGGVTEEIYQTGPLSVLNLRCSVEAQYEWLKREKPYYLLTYPSNALELAKYFKERGEQLPSLREVRTLSESIGPALRDLCLEVWNAPVVDIYSARETGYLALQCPEHQHYHVQSENVFVEILNDEGNPCNPGEVGRVIVTTLHNYASPLIRYEIGDYAEVGRPCDCGRGLPVLNRIAGRVRNMLTLPTGEKFWPLFLSMHSASDAPITQLQIVQRTLNKLEVRVVVDRSLFDQERVELTRVLHDFLHYPFELEFVECQQIERSKSGKFEEFYSEL